MAKRIIRMHLNEYSIDRAIAHLEQYKQTLEYKAELLRKRLAERIRGLSSDGFNSSYVDDIVNGIPRQARVDVTVKNQEIVSVVVASGEDAIWVEFGAGVFHNGPAGSSPNPNGAKLGYTIGSYGQGKGKRPVWGYRDDDGELILTHGTEATMPMYHAMRQVENEIYEIAREVFR